jgi:hypothetical protein
MSESSTLELMLLRWGEGPSGRTVTFLLPDDPGPHPFRGLKCGPAHGQRLGAAFALINDDETTTAVEPAPQVSEKPKGGGNGEGVGKHRLSRQAALCCADKRFHRFLIEEADLDEGYFGDDDYVAHTVRDLCIVDSRREFDTDPNAGARWKQLYATYVAWREAA